MFDPAETKTRISEAVEYFLQTDPALASKLAEALVALQAATNPQDYVWTETCVPEKEFFRLTLWRGKGGIEVASLNPSSYHWVQYCGSGWNLDMRTPTQHRTYLGQISGFQFSCAFLRARAKKEWGCPLTEEEAKLADIRPSKPWA